VALERADVAEKKAKADAEHAAKTAKDAADAQKRRDDRESARKADEAKRMTIATTTEMEMVEVLLDARKAVYAGFVHGRMPTRDEHHVMFQTLFKAHQEADAMFANLNKRDMPMYHNSTLCTQLAAMAAAHNLSQYMHEWESTLNSNAMPQGTVASIGVKKADDRDETRIRTLNAPVGGNVSTAAAAASVSAPKSNNTDGDTTSTVSDDDLWGSDRDDHPVTAPAGDGPQRRFVTDGFGLVVACDSTGTAIEHDKLPDGQADASAAAIATRRRRTGSEERRPQLQAQPVDAEESSVARITRSQLRAACGPADRTRSRSRA